MVNVTDIEIPSSIPSELWTDIYNRQKELKEKYHQIETSNKVGYAHVQGLPFDLDSPRWQENIKAQIFRVLEEIAEAMAAHTQEHFFEELIDALHFAVELQITLGYNLPEINSNPDPSGTPKYYMESLILKHYGLAANQLKNKPWKNTFQPTDEKRFKQQINRGIRTLAELILGHMDLEEMYIYYFKKNKVNQFRQQSNY